MSCFVMWHSMTNIAHKSCKARLSLSRKPDDRTIANKFYGLVQLLTIKCLNESKLRLQKTKDAKSSRSFLGIINERKARCVHCQIIVTSGAESWSNVFELSNLTFPMLTISMDMEYSCIRFSV